MKPFIYLTFIFITFVGYSQTATSSKYEIGMQKAFSLWEEGKMADAANMFERIAAVEKDNWLPSYYVAQLKVLQAFNTKDESILKPLLTSALNFINDAKTLSKDNVDIIILDAQYYTAWVAFDGQKYGMKYAGKISQMYKDALKMEPSNPRVILSKAEWDMGSASFFGQSVTPYCKEIARAITLFDTFEPAGAFYPSYGKERAQELVQTTCKEQ